MTEPLGQSQVLPYMTGLSARGVGVEILSFEPTATSPSLIEDLRARLKTQGVSWQPLVRSPSHALGRKAWEIGTAFRRGLAMALARRPDIVHARSYLPAVAADAIARVVPGAKFLFDVRGMLGDENVDAGYWTRESLRYRVLKRYERRLFCSADGMVVLTRALLRYLRSERAVPEGTPIQVIPCCVDTDRFRLDSDARIRARARLGVEGRTVVVYSGTLGSTVRHDPRHLTKEMSAFVAALRRLRPDTVWLVLTQSDPSELIAVARTEGIEGDSLVVRKVAPAEMPSELLAGDLGLAFIQPCFSKVGASPTKIAEFFSCGLLPVFNDEVGDLGELAAKGSSVVLPASFGTEAIQHAASSASSLMDQPYLQRAERARRIAIDSYSLSKIGVPSYHELYETMCSSR
jgi:glycosyltransferase involved in cell wall biosynthesis